MISNINRKFEAKEGLVADCEIIIDNKKLIQRIYQVSKITKMNKILKRMFLLGLILYSNFKAICQSTPPPEYYHNIAIGDSLFDSKDFINASIKYSEAFKTFGWRGIPDDRYKAAQAFGYANNIDSLMSYLNILSSKSRYWNYQKMANDSAFEKVKHTSKWNELINFIKENKKTYYPKINIEWYNFLDTIYQDDIRYRKLGGDSDVQKNLEKSIKTDSINIIKISKFIDSYGWQDEEVVGVYGNIALFLVIQHAPNSYQEKYLPILKKAVAEKKAKPQSLALLEDRISVNKTGHQIYGSQLRQDPITYINSLWPIIDEANVNIRRKSVGLDPIEEYLKRAFNIDYNYKIKLLNK